MELKYLRFLLLLMLFAHHKSSVSVIAGVEEVLNNPKVIRKVAIPINRRGGTVSGGHGAGEHGSPAGENGDHTPNTAGVVPLYAAASHHGNNNRHHGAANGRNDCISLSTIVAAAIITSLLFFISS